VGESLACTDKSLLPLQMSPGLRGPLSLFMQLIARASRASNFCRIASPPAWTIAIIMAPLRASKSCSHTSSKFPNTPPPAANWVSPASPNPARPAASARSHQTIDLAEGTHGLVILTNANFWRSASVPTLLCQRYPANKVLTRLAVPSPE